MDAKELKEVLVEYNSSKFSPQQCDVKELRNEMMKVFKIRKEFIIQMKREDWGGEFVDVSEAESIPDHSVVRIVPLEIGPEHRKTASEVRML